MDPAGTRPDATVGNQLRLLQGVCQVSGSTTDLPDVLVVAVGWVRQAAGDATAAVRISVPDGGERLRTAVTVGDWGISSRKRSAWRRKVFRSGEIIARPVRAHGDTVMMTMPLAVNGGAVGVLEVLAGEREMRDRSETLAAVAAQIAGVVHHAYAQQEMDRMSARLRRASTLSDELMRARTSERAVRAAVKLVALRTGGPAVGWALGAGGCMRLMAQSGLRATTWRDVRTRFAEIPDWTHLRERDRHGLLEEFGAVVGSGDVGVLRVRDALLLTVKQGDPGVHAAMQRILDETFRHVGDVEDLRRAREGLDLGLAITAHEVRGPLLAVRAAVDCMLARSSDADRALLTRTKSQLDDLTALMDHLLLWSVHAEGPTPGRYDLVAAVRRAVDAVDALIDSPRITVETPERLFAHFEPNNLQIALGNVLRNASAYSPESGRIAVSIERQDEWAVVSVSDDGPGISALEREVVFLPLVRGTAGAAHAGIGLGLYITRSVVEAQGGWVSLEPSDQGAMFSIHLPAEPEPPRPASAS